MSECKHELFIAWGSVMVMCKHCHYAINKDAANAMLNEHASLQKENERLNKLLRMYRLKLRVDASKVGE